MYITQSTGEVLVRCTRFLGLLEFTQETSQTSSPTKEKQFMKNHAERPHICFGVDLVEQPGVRRR